MKPVYSVSFRLQRLTSESAHVSVPITDDLFVASADNPSQMSVDPEKLVAVAIEIARRLPSTAWKTEGEPLVQPHPVQTAPDAY
jgi:hypothetical protein